MSSTSGEVEAAVHRIWSHEAVRRLATLSDDGVSVGVERVLAALGDLVGERRLGNPATPTIIMTADLEAKEAAPLTD